MQSEARLSAARLALGISFVLAGCGLPSQMFEKRSCDDAKWNDWTPQIEASTGNAVVAWGCRGNSGTTIQVIDNAGSTATLASVERATIAISRDGRYAAYSARPSGGTFLYDFQSRSTEQVTDGSSVDGVAKDETWPTLAFDANDDLVWISEGPGDTSGKTPSLVFKRTRAGEITKVAKFDEIATAVLSPNGKILALAAAQHRGQGFSLWLLDLTSAAVRAIWDAGDIQYIRWTSDSGGFLEAKNLMSDGRPARTRPPTAADYFKQYHLLPGSVFSWDGSAAKPIRLEVGGQEAGNIAVSPSGSDLAVTGWRDNQAGPLRSNLWLVDLETRATRNLTPDQQAGDGQLFSPGGSMLLYGIESSLLLWDFKSHRIISVNPRGSWAAWDLDTSIAWRPDESFYFFSNMTDVHHANTIGRLALWLRKPDGTTRLVSTRP